MRKWLLGVVVLVAALLGAGVAYAAIPGPDGVIHGCYSTGLGSGALYVIDSEEECPMGYAALNWNQTAPAGLAGYEVLSPGFVIVGPHSAHTHSASLECPVGKVVLSGGGDGSSKPQADGTGWDFTFAHGHVFENAELHVTAWIICAEVAT